MEQQIGKACNKKIVMVLDTSQTIEIARTSLFSIKRGTLEKTKIKMLMEPKSVSPRDHRCLNDIF